MEPEFITYKKFEDIALAEELAARLEHYEIEYLIAEEAFRFDPSLVMSNATKEYAVKIKSADFEKVNELLKADESEDVTKIDKDYYLFDFTDMELTDVITKADEWSAFDVVLARKILADKGKPMSDETIVAIQKKRIDDLKKPERSQDLYIVIGYAFAAVGGILGFFIGWHLSTYKKTLPDGERLYAYNDNDRKQGKIIFYLSFVGLAIALIYVLIPVFNG